MSGTGNAQERIEELVFGLASEVEDERRLCLTWLAQIGTEEVLPHLERMTSDPAPGVCGLARQLAAELRDRLELAKERPWGVDPIELLAHADPRARLAGAMIAYDKHSDALKSVLVARLETEEDAFVRASLVKALRHYPDPAVLELLADSLLDADARVRSNTVEALMAYDHPALTKRVSHLLHDPDMRVQGTVLIYLAKRVPDRIRPLMEKMATSPESWARRTARYVYRALGWDPPELAGHAVEGGEARAMLGSKHHETRVKGVWKALEQPVDERLDMLRRALATEEHPHVIATLTRALGHPGHTEDLPLLAKHLTSEDARVRANTVEGVARVGGVDALHLLEPMVEDAAPRVRSAVLLAVEKLRRRRAMGALRVLLDSEAPADLSQGVLELSRMPRGEAEQVLDTLKGAWDAGRRRQVVQMLTGLKLHGSAQAFADELCLRWSSETAPGAAAAPAGEARLAVQGAHVLKLWETGRLSHEEYRPDIALVEQAEEEIAQGKLVQEAIRRRRDALVRLAKTAVKLGDAEGIQRSHTRTLAALKPAGPVPVAEASSSSAVKIEGAVEKLAQDDPTQRSYLPGGFRRLGTRRTRGVSAATLRTAAVASAVIALLSVGLFVRSLNAPRPTPSPVIRPGSAPASAAASPSAAPSAAARLVSRTGRIVEIRDDGRRLTLDSGDQRTQVQCTEYPRKEPRIGDQLTVTGMVSVSGSVELLLIERLPRDR